MIRHGTPKIAAELRSRKESDLVHACWQALLAGDGEPWMALGTVLFDRRTRTRWLPALAATDAAGTLHLPPFLEHLIPAGMHRLPSGWWEFLLSHTDPTGHLIPEGSPPQELLRELLEAETRPCLEPLLLGRLPASLRSPQMSPWLLRLDHEVWMLDPRLRAWARGLGLWPAALQSLVPASLALGDPHSPKERPYPTQREWGYPIAGTRVHPCADPFHWLEEGQQAMTAWAPERALNALAWSHAHFQRLKDASGARRAASEAVKAALLRGELNQAATWQKIRGPLEPPERELEDVAFTMARGQGNRALSMARKLMQSHPARHEPWVLLAKQGLLRDRPDWVREALPQIEANGLRQLLLASLDPGTEPELAELDPDERLLWAFLRGKRAGMLLPEFEDVWDACPNQPLRLETGLRLLEALPELRCAKHLLQLRVLTDRISSSDYQTRLDALWPAAEPGQEPRPDEVLERWLDQQQQPTWLVWGSADRPRTLGRGMSPPDGLLASLRNQAVVGPFTMDGKIWWGHALQWEGNTVGSLLTILDEGKPLQIQPEAHLVAPWLARLAPSVLGDIKVEATRLLTDGSEPMASILKELARVARSDLPVLVLGPTGSGKELAAREIHARSGRRGPFIPLNCSEYAETLMESELFGHVKGAFTGAHSERKGAIETAEGGTLLLDEVADLSLKLQSLFLRVLQEKEVRRVGSDCIHKVNVRFLAATHRSLEQMVATGQFRRDLHYRLQGAVLTLPSLWERRHEFPFLIPRLIASVAKEAGLEQPDISPALASTLARRPWLGNFRELRHAITRALLRCEDGPLKVSHFPELDKPRIQQKSWNEATRIFQRELLLDALRRHQFQITDAAWHLGLTRPALYLVSKRLGVDIAEERTHWQMVGAASTSDQNGRGRP